MATFHRTSVLLALLLGLVIGIPLHVTYAQDVPPPRDVWLWNREVILTPGGRAQVLQFAREQRVRAIYIESPVLLSNYPNTLSTFIAEAATYGIQVELLMGDPRWALSSYHDDAISLAQQAVAFTLQLTGPRPIGLHVDVEPYALPEWTTDRNGTANQYLDLLEKLQAEVQGTPLILTVDIPFWYDGVTVTRNGQTRSMHMWTIDMVDRVTIMAYRDHAQPPDGIIDHVSNEIAYANTRGKRVVIGVETQCGLWPEKISFCEEGLAAMESALAEVQSTYRSAPAFDNFAVHDYRSYRDLVAAAATPTPSPTPTRTPTPTPSPTPTWTPTFTPTSTPTFTPTFTPTPTTSPTPSPTPTPSPPPPPTSTPTFTPTLTPSPTPTPSPTYTLTPTPTPPPQHSVFVPLIP